MMRHTPVAIVAAIGCTFAVEAAAADVFDADIMEIVPTGAVAGDGKTAVTVRLFARSADGSALTGLKPKITASEGSVGAVTAAGEGWYSFELTPPSTSQPVKVTLTAKAGALSSEAEIPVVPAGQGTLKITANPTSLILGRTDTATLSFQVDGDVPAADLEIAASSGEVTDVTDMGGGLFTARYKPPSVNYPHLAIISAVARNHADLAASTVVKLQGAVDFPVTAAAGTSVVLKIAGGDYGPVKMDASGKGKVPIIVSPGINEARKVVVKDGQREETPFDLQIPETRRIAFMPPTGGVPLDGRAHPVRIVVRKPDGSPDGGANLELSVDKGTLGKPRHVGDGLYVADFTPSAAGVAKISADLPGTQKNQTELEVTVLGKLPDTVGWDALASVPASSGSAAGVVIVPRSRVVHADGSAKVTLFVAAVDTAGYPVPGARVELSASSGKVPGSVTANASGVATAVYTSPAKAGFVRIAGTSGALSTEAALVATENPIELVWPRSSGAQGDWEARLPGESASGGTGVTTPEPTEPQPVSKSMDVAAAGAEITAVELTPPTSVAPGSTLVLTARALTEDGKGVPGAEIDFLTNAGTFGPVTDAGDGTYTAELSVPKKATGELKLSVVAGSGAMARSTLAIDPGAIAPVPDKPRPDKPPKEPKEAADTPWLRVRAGGAGGSYKYAQRPSESPGPLLPRSLVVGGPDGGSPAGLAGIEADARAWFLPYVGAHVGFRSTRYSISAETFSDPAPDWITHLRADAAVRYPFAVGSDQFWIGASGGFQLDDFIVFKGCLEPGCEVTYEPLTLPGLEVGAELGAEVGPLFFIGNVSRGFAFATVGYRTGVDVDIGYEVHENVFVDLGGAFISRRLRVEGDTSGTEFGQLEDTQLVGRLSVGFQL
ncbi:MAG: invasin domain 3-containing protein [Myxococcota bacterium]